MPTNIVATARPGRAELVEKWSQFRPADRALCKGVAGMGAMPSYTELISCLEMARDAREVNSRNAAGEPPGAAGASVAARSAR